MIDLLKKGLPNVKLILNSCFLQSYGCKIKKFQKKLAKIKSICYNHNVILYDYDTLKEVNINERRNSSRVQAYNH